MASYIPGIQDYISQYQPWSPDYNFLSNVLQQRQSKYDQSYKQLNSQYGTLLNSPLIREDNIQDRDKFFKMIDGDIKRISGMDLSLQQNVDSANKVFDSFHQNKDLMYDMNFTREHKNQKEIAEGFRNCKDQEVCGGKYWDEGVQFLDYKAEDFKNASKEDARKMSPGKYTPYIDLTEKAMKFGKDFLTKGGGFGVERVRSEGGFRITDKNGYLIETPLNDFLLAEYGQDQKVKDMMHTKAYVQRKNYIGTQVQQGVDPTVAETNYFNEIDSLSKHMIDENQNKQKNNQALQAKFQLAKETIKNNGSTGTDEIAKTLWGSGTDAAASEQSAKVYDTTAKAANSIFEAGDDINLKRQRVDNFAANAFLHHATAVGAHVVADLTFQQSSEVDPYAKSLYDFQLDLKKELFKADISDKLDQNKQLREFMLKRKTAELEQTGDPTGIENNPKFKEGQSGTTATKGVDLAASMHSDVENAAAPLHSTQTQYTAGYTGTLRSIINSNASSSAKLTAQQTLINIWGNAKRDAKGKVIMPGYDIRLHKFVDREGRMHDDPDEMINEYNAGDLYARASAAAKSNSAFPQHGDFINGQGAKLQKAIDQQNEMYQINSTNFKNNNLATKKYGAFKEDITNDPDTKLAWNTLIDKKGELATQEGFKHDFVKNYLQVHQGEDSETTLISDALDIAEKQYSKVKKHYDNIFNGGISIGMQNGKKVPLIKPNMPSFDAFGNGTSTGGSLVSQFSAQSPASFGARGFVTSMHDYMGDNNAMAMFGLPGDIEEATKKNSNEGDQAKEILNTIFSDFKGGNKDLKKDLVASIEYLDLAAGDKDKVAVNIKPSQAYLRHYQNKEASKKHPTWADDSKLYTEGVTFIMDRKKASNSFTEAVTWKPMDIILTNKDKTIDVPNAGSITIHKKDENGNFRVDGYITGYQKDKTGKYQPVNVFNVAKTYSDNPSGDLLYNTLQTYLQQAAQSNKRLLANEPNSLIHDWTKLPEVMTQLKASSGQVQEPDYSNIFSGLNTFTQ